MDEAYRNAYKKYCGCEKCTPRQGWSRHVKTEEKNWVEEALKHAEDEPTFKDLDALRSRRKVLVTKRKNALKIEQHLIEELDAKLAALDEEIKTEEEFQRQQREPETYQGYKRIHLDVPLSWRTTEGRATLPRLAVYRLDSNEMSIRSGDSFTKSEPFSATWFIGTFLLGVVAVLALFVQLGHFLFVGEQGFGWSWVYNPAAIAASWFSVFAVTRWIALRRSNGIFPGLPKALAKHFDDVLKDNYRESSSYESYQFNRTTYFTGSIPDETKQKINESKSVFGKKNLFIIAEAGPWKNDDRVIRNIDPLVIGLKGNTTYLVDTFDLVPIEEAVVGEFSE